jgi:hypothetical protein
VATATLKDHSHENNHHFCCAIETRGQNIVVLGEPEGFTKSRLLVNRCDGTHIVISLTIDVCQLSTLQRQSKKEYMKR